MREIEVLHHQVVESSGFFERNKLEVHFDGLRERRVRIGNLQNVTKSQISKLFDPVTKYLPSTNLEII